MQLHEAVRDGAEVPFQLWMPLEDLVKSQAENPEVSRPVQGFASTDDQDLQREILVQKGLDVRPLLETGYLDWDHRSRTGGPEYLIGEPTFAETRKTPRGEGLWLKGFLYEDNVHADAVWAHLQRQAAGKTHRTMGFSIDGGVRLRDGRFIKSAVIRHTALTHQPINPFTWAQLAKSLASGDAAPIAQGYLATPHTGDCAACREAALVHLINHRGLDAGAATEQIVRWHQSGLY